MHNLALQHFAHLGCQFLLRKVGAGKVRIETQAASLDEAYCAIHPGFCPGDFVMLAVSDYTFS
jgi:hypothetical protein